MTFDLEHEHAFFVHEDPRWLICRCGQYARRARTLHGQPEIRLIDPPTPVFLPRPALDLVECPGAIAEPQDADVSQVDPDRAAVELQVSI